MAVTITEGFRLNGKKGNRVIIQEYRKSTKGIEPSGHIFDQVALSRFEVWFHPYDGSTPVKISK